MIQATCEAVATWVDTLSLEGGVSAQFMWVPVVEREAITGPKIIVSPATHAPIRRNRAVLDGAVEVDIAIAKPCEKAGATACNTVIGYAEEVIEAAFSLALLGVGKVIDISHPVVIDQEIFRQQNVALTVVRLAIRSY